MKLTKEQKNKIFDLLCDSNGHSGGGSQVINYVNTLLERSDNSDYAVSATLAPKLPSLNDVKEYLGYGCDKEGSVEGAYEAIKKLGNFT